MKKLFDITWVGMVDFPGQMEFSALHSSALHLYSTNLVHFFCTF